jgi:hypothetical protein
MRVNDRIIISHEQYHHFTRALTVFNLQSKIRESFQLQHNYGQRMKVMLLSSVTVIKM